LKTSASGRDDTTYTVKIKVTGNTSTDSVSVDGAGYIGKSGTEYTFSAGSTSANVSIAAKDSAAVIKSNDLSPSQGTGTLAGNINISAGAKTVTYTISSNMDTTSYTFTIKVLEE